MLSPEKRQLGETASERNTSSCAPARCRIETKRRPAIRAKRCPSCAMFPTDNVCGVVCLCVGTQRCRAISRKMQRSAAQHIALAITVAVHLPQGHGMATALAFMTGNGSMAIKNSQQTPLLPLPPPWRRRDQARPSRAGRHVSDWPRWKPATPLLQFLGRRCSWPPPETE